MPPISSHTDSATRVLRVITRLNIGGPAIQAIELSHRLGACGFETVLVHGRLAAGEGDMRYLLPAATRTRYIPSLRRPVAPAHDARAVAELLKLLDDFQPHIVHTHTAKAGTIGRIAAALHNRLRPQGRRTKVVHTYHGHVLDGYFNRATTRLFLAVERRLAPTTDRIVAISPAIRRELVDMYRIGRPDQYRVVPLGFDLRALSAIDDRSRAAARRSLDIPAGAKVVTTVGRLTAVKQHALFVEAASLVARRDAAALFLIVGDGELRAELEQLARTRGIIDRTRFLGWRRDLATIYGATDVFLLTSRNEGTPVALIESLAAATPGVSTDVGGVSDVIDSDDVGLLAPDGDAGALADRVCALLGDDRRRRAMGERGRESVTSRFDIARLVDDMARLYRELLG